MFFRVSVDPLAEFNLYLKNKENQKPIINYWSQPRSNQSQSPPISLYNESSGRRNKKRSQASSLYGDSSRSRKRERSASNYENSSRRKRRRTRSPSSDKGYWSFDNSQNYNR